MEKFLTLKKLFFFVISSDPSFKEVHVRFTMVPVKPSITGKISSLFSFKNV